jgi:Domain of unknown function (DUF4185)
MPIAAYRRLLKAGVIVAAILATAMVAVSPGLRARPLPEATVTLLNPVLGQDAPSGQVVFPKEPPGGVTAADLGAPAYFKGSWYLVFGDASYLLPVYPEGQNFLVANAKLTPGKSMALTNFLALVHDDQYRISAAARAIEPDPGYVIPAALYAVHWQGKSALIAAYMEGGNFGGLDHWSRDTRLAIYDQSARVFRPYKPAHYHWQSPARHSTNAPYSQYDFGQSSFWQDDTYLYMAGSATNRFGGLKLARIPLAWFLDAADRHGWEYYLGDNTWSSATTDEARIQQRVAWLIPAADPSYAGRTTARASGCLWLGVGEFSLLWDPYLDRFLVLSGSDGCTAPAMLRIYSSPALTGPWTKYPMNVPMPHPTWDYYAPYSSPDLLQDGGRTVYFVASTYRRYGVYFYKLRF